MIKWLKHQLDKLPSSPGLIQPGKWYVRYPDCDGDGGQKSQNMTYDVCKNLKEIYGGSIHHVDR